MNQEVLRDIKRSQNFEDTEEFTKQRIQEMCDRKKNICGSGNLFFIYKGSYCYLTLSIKSSCLLCKSLPSLERVSIANSMFF